jgi:alkanesulfonate monooxygenase SsuD/methylene tetrahydromethanopterin reductase-like flavin-dependent oxidoreductase (luciferase family)
MFANTMAWADGPGALEAAQAAEAAGFESLWTVEHVGRPAADRVIRPTASV